MKRRSILAGVGAGMASALAGCAGAVRRLEFASVSQRETEDGVVIEVGVTATTNVRGEESDFYEVTAAAYTCDGRRVCHADVGHVPDDASQENPVTATLECETVPDGIALGARTGPCDSGVASYTWAVNGAEGWTVNNFDRQCKDRLPPERLCRAIGETRAPGTVVVDEPAGNASENGTDTDAG